MRKNIAEKNCGANSNVATAVGYVMNASSAPPPFMTSVIGTFNSNDKFPRIEKTNVAARIAVRVSVIPIMIPSLQYY